jgi:hypothetical protein
MKNIITAKLTFSPVPGLFKYFLCERKEIETKLDFIKKHISEKIQPLEIVPNQQMG